MLDSIGWKFKVAKPTYTYLTMSHSKTQCAGLNWKYGIK